MLRKRSFPRQSHRADVWTAAAMLVATGCGAGGEDASDEWQFAVTTRPNGTGHAVNTPPADGGHPTFMLEESLRIGSIDEEGPASFGQVRGLAVTLDGRIAVLDALAQEIRLFAPTGEHLATFGGKGEGPGEMTGGYGLMLAPDGALWLADHQNGRMSVFDPDEGFLRSFPIPVFSYAFIWRGAMTEDGTILKPSFRMGGGPQTPILRVYDQELELLDSLPLPATPEVVDPENPPNAFFFKMPGGGQGYIQVPYYPLGRQLLDPRGVIWSTGRGDPSYRIAMWEPGGDTTLVLETLRSPVPVTGSERDSSINRIQDQLEELGAAPGQDWSKIPETKPAVISMFTSEDGKLWVRRASSGPNIEYDVYERDGRRIGGVATSLRIWDYVAPVVRGDQFWAVVTDELGVAYVVRARMPRIEPTESPR